jgi:hypothetical protein
MVSNDEDNTTQATVRKNEMQKGIEGDRRRKEEIKKEEGWKKKRRKN